MTNQEENMSTVKTAISIDKTLLDHISKLAVEINLSRSQIFTQAVQYFIDKKNDLDLIRRINQAYPDILDADETERLTKSKKKYQEIVKDTW